MMRTWPVIALVVVLSGSAALSGCAYALSGRGNTLPADVRRIGIPQFQNLSNIPELDQLITDAVRLEFRSRGKFTPVPETTGVDAVLTGSVRSVQVAPIGFTTDTRQASKYSITVLASAEFKLTKDGKVFWSSPALRVTDEYDVASGVSVTDPAVIFTQDRNALDRMAKAFARSLVTSILEAF